MPAWKKYLRAGVSILGTAIGIGVATIPFHRGLQVAAAGDPMGGFKAIAIDVGAPVAGAQINVSKLIGVGVAAGVGLAIISVFRHLARRV